MLKTILLIGSLLLTPAVIMAQVAPSAHGGDTGLWVGGQYSTFKPDYNKVRLRGIGAYADYYLTSSIAAEGEVRLSGVLGSQDGGETQKDYLVGPSYRLYNWHHISADAKFLVGGVWIVFPNHIGTGSYFAFVPGGNINYRFNQRWSARVDYEYQFLPSAPNIPGEPNHGLTPNGWSFGLSYKVF